MTVGHVRHLCKIQALFHTFSACKLLLINKTLKTGSHETEGRREHNNKQMLNGGDREKKKIHPNLGQHHVYHLFTNEQPNSPLEGSIALDHFNKVCLVPRPNYYLDLLLVREHLADTLDAIMSLYFKSVSVSATQNFFFETLLHSTSLR